jgi:hypothetical protein
MNTTENKHDRQDQFHPQQDQQQKTRQQQEAKKQGQKPDMLHKDLDHHQVHEHESIETRMTR